MSERLPPSRSHDDARIERATRLVRFVMSTGLMLFGAWNYASDRWTPAIFWVLLGIWFQNVEP